MLVVAADIGQRAVVAFDAVTYELKYKVKVVCGPIKISKLILSTCDPDDPESCYVVMTTNVPTYPSPIHKATTGEQVKELSRVGCFDQQVWALETIHGKPASYCSDGESVCGHVVAGNIDGDLELFNAESDASTSLSAVPSSQLGDIRAILSLAPWGMPDSLWVGCSNLHVYDLRKVALVKFQPLEEQTAGALEANETGSCVYCLTDRVLMWDRRTYRPTTLRLSLSDEASSSCFCPDKHLLISGNQDGAVEGIDTRKPTDELFCSEVCISPVYGIARIGKEKFVSCSNTMVWWTPGSGAKKGVKELNRGSRGRDFSPFLYEGCCTVGGPFDRPAFVAGEAVDPFFLERCEFIQEILPVFGSAVVVREGALVLVSSRILGLFTEE